MLATHYPIWSLTKPIEYFVSFDDYLLPILRKNMLDLYINGHEHITSFSHFKNDAVMTHLDAPDFESQIDRTEYWFDSVKERFS